VGDNEDGEDERSIESHIVSIQQQWGRPNCDMISLSERMARTFTARREMVVAGEKTPRHSYQISSTQRFFSGTQYYSLCILYCLVKLSLFDK